MIRRVKDYDKKLVSLFPSLKEDTPFVRKSMEGITAESESEITEDGQYISTGYITTLDIDRDNEVILQSGIDWSEYKTNNVVLHMHDYRELPVGKCIKLEQDALGWKATTKYFVNEKKDSQGFKNWEYRNAGFPLGRSIGFRPTEYAVNPKYGDEFALGWKLGKNQWSQEYMRAYGKEPDFEPDIIWTASKANEFSDVTIGANQGCVSDEDTGPMDIISLSKGFGDGKISMDLLIKRLKENPNVKEIVENKNDENFNTASDGEDMEELKNKIEEQEKEIQELKLQIKEILESQKKIKDDEDPIKKDPIIDKKEKEKTEEKEKSVNITMEDITEMLLESGMKTINQSIDKITEDVLKLQDEIAQLTGSI